MQISNLKSLAAKLAELGWHLQLLIDVSQFADLYSALTDLPVPTVFDHMGHMPVQQGINQPGFQAMLRLISEGKSWAKLSGSYRFTGQQEAPYSDVTAFARTIIAANPDQVVYGSDWPHPHFDIPMPEDGALLNMLPDWAPDAHLRQKILADNPARLYDFPA
ncbi:amidohydrolase family protein [Aliamphritea spongicola]|nr:amidohydrolase family protein [Aliamphritea spongicola]